jgi:hypothetical protein
VRARQGKTTPCAEGRQDAIAREPSVAGLAQLNTGTISMAVNIIIGLWGLAAGFLGKKK